MRNFSLMLVSLLVTVNVISQTPDYDAIADKIVNHSLEVIPGEIVAISGTSAEIDLMSALFVAVVKAGGQPFVKLSLPEANKRAFMEMPEEYLKMTSTYTLFESRIVDCYINTGSVQDPDLWSDVPEERVAMARKAGDPLRYANNLVEFRSVSLGQIGGIPTKVYAESVGANYNEMIDVFWKAVNTDYSEMLSRGKQLEGILHSKDEVKITSKDGTNISFSLSGIKPGINSGRTNEEGKTGGQRYAWLPAGEVYTTIDLKSANGILVVREMDFRGNRVENLKLTFVNGSISGIEADKNGDLIQKFYDNHPEKASILSAFDIGINPDSHPPKNSEYYSFEMSGMVSLVVGDNYWAGGDISTGAGLVFFQPDATVIIGGKEIIKNGVLTEK